MKQTINGFPEHFSGLNDTIHKLFGKSPQNKNILQNIIHNILVNRKDF